MTTDTFNVFEKRFLNTNKGLVLGTLNKLGLLLVKDDANKLSLQKAATALDKKGFLALVKSIEALLSRENVWDFKEVVDTVVKGCLAHVKGYDFMKDLPDIKIIESVVEDKGGMEAVIRQMRLDDSVSLMSNPNPCLIMNF